MMMTWLVGFGLVALGCAVGMLVFSVLTTGKQADHDEQVAYMQREIDRLEYELQHALEDLDEARGS